MAVKTGMYAINNQGRVIGRVNAAASQAARILLHNDKRSAIPVVIGNQRVGAIAVGIGSGTKLIHIPIDSNIRAGDDVKVQYAGQDGLKYYTMGTVDRIQTTPDKTFLIAKLAQENLIKDSEWLVLI